MTILVGDIGGTNARFAIATAPPEPLRLGFEWKAPSSGFAGMSEAVVAYGEAIPEAMKCRWACLGLPGPVRGNRCAVTNLPWIVDGEELAATLDLEAALLLNDLEAAAFGLEVLDPRHLKVLAPGTQGVPGNRALLAAGTGHGQAGLVWDGRRHHPFATEGGHTDFGPSDELQVELWRYLTARHGRVSWERVVSGQGMVEIFGFLAQRSGSDAPEWFVAAREGGTAAAEITARARAGDCRWCTETIELFLALLGAEAGNLALKLLATGGVYVAGGIVPRLIPELERSRFVERFQAKGRMRPLLETIPVSVVLDDRLALWGAAARMRRHLADVAAPEPRAASPATARRRTSAG